MPSRRTSPGSSCPPRRRSGRPVDILLGLLLVLGATPGIALAEPGEPLRLEARVYGGFSQRRVSIRVEPDRATTIEVGPREPQEPPVVVTLTLTVAEMDDLREAVVASRFFEEWDRGLPPLDAPVWDLSVSLGGRERSRSHVPIAEGQPEFAPLEGFLRRLVGQGRITADLRRGNWRSAHAAIRHGPQHAVLRWPLLAPALLVCARQAKDAAAGGEVAQPLVRLVPPAEWQGIAQEFLSDLDDLWRAEVLGGWQKEIQTYRLAEYEASWSDLAFAEVTRWWKGAPPPSDPALWPMAHLIARLLAERRVPAFGIAEGMARRYSTFDRAFRPQGLLDVGVDAVPSVRRLLEDPEPRARFAGAVFAVDLVALSQGKWPQAVHLAEEERPALSERLSSEIAPLLERLARDLAEPAATREQCWKALDSLAGRDRRAERLAAERAARARAAASAPGTPPPAPAPEPPAVPLSIAGRVVAEGDVPVGEVKVVARRSDGTPGVGSAVTGPDGAFRIEGLGAGSYRVLAAPARSVHAPEDPPSVRGDVPAGTSDLVLRLTGSMIRGRLLDAAGAPAPGERVVARMRDAPTEFHAPYPVTGDVTETDPDGRFLLVRLMPGLYDLAVVGRDALEGASGLVAGPQERVVRILEGATISGRVVDEEGEPLSGETVAAKPVGGTDGYVSAPVAGDGTFRVPGLVPGRSYALWVTLGRGAPPYRSSPVLEVVAGASDVVLRVDTSPQVRVRIEPSARSLGGVRLTRVEGGSRCEIDFREPPVVLRAAPGTWKVEALVRDLDANGDRLHRWIDLGTVEGGEPERTFVVPP